MAQPVYDDLAETHDEDLATRAVDRYGDLLQDVTPGAADDAVETVLQDYEQPDFAAAVETAARDYLRDLQGLDATDERVHPGEYYAYELTAYNVKQFEDRMDLSGSDRTVDEARTWIRTQAGADGVFLDGGDTIAVAFREAAEKVVLDALEKQEHPHIDVDAARGHHRLRYAVAHALK